MDRNKAKKVSMIVRKCNCSYQKHAQYRKKKKKKTIIVIRVDDILSKWIPTIRKKVNPNEVYHSIRGLTDFDRNHIERALDRGGPQIAADKMVEAIKRRDPRSGFLSFLAALYENNYSDLADQILVSSKMQNLQPIQNAIYEERARLMHPSLPSTMATAAIAPIQNPLDEIRQLNNHHGPHRSRMQQYNPHVDHHMAKWIQHQNNRHPHVESSRGWQINLNPVSHSQYTSTQVAQHHPGNHSNQLIGYPHNSVNQINSHSNLVPQNSANMQMPPSSYNMPPSSYNMPPSSYSMPASCNIPASCNMPASHQLPHCIMPVLPNQSSCDQIINNTQAMPQSNTPTSGQQQPLDRDNDINDIPYDEFDKLVITLNEEPHPGWKTLATEFKIPRGKVKEFSGSENPAEELLDYLFEEKKLTIRELKSHLQNAGLNSADSCIQCEGLNSADSCIQCEGLNSAIHCEGLNSADSCIQCEGLNSADSCIQCEDLQLDNGNNSHGSSNTNNIPGHLENISLNGLDNDIVPSEIDAFNHRNRHKQKDYFSEKTIKSAGYQPTATKSYSVAMDNKQEVLEAGSGYSAKISAMASLGYLQLLQTSQVTSSHVTNNKIAELDFSEVKKNGEQSYPLSTQRSQRSSSSSQAKYNLTSEQVPTTGVTSVIVDNGQQNQKEILKQHKTLVIKADVHKERKILKKSKELYI
ncbi:hypothetical protein KUTeg_008095 [Tegillarca granosa]|uniref:Caspase recruitment domain-containing protein n=1 Tax=Tegillarca granosa TaxID=220873 RepID=A0ABQ9F846_TEGGR|nr:hypothetical protein KUTeg_008095 [Tegillarca granosa]